MHDIQSQHCRAMRRSIHACHTKSALQSLYIASIQRILKSQCHSIFAIQRHDTLTFEHSPELHFRNPPRPPPHLPPQLPRADHWQKCGGPQDQGTPSDVYPHHQRQSALDYRCAFECGPYTTRRHQRAFPHVRPPGTNPPPPSPGPWHRAATVVLQGAVILLFAGRHLESR